ncbi:hypothetical protein E2C01_090640 [Portunus trituberculatus]|uniref:Secreted protein n=1 Tax=Portunus trituberculatus TaxID=210409 RepID=A0A5B7JQX1_PORTR|nr:hypothetical protein [Portunus trituberculatus]
MSALLAAICGLLRIGETVVQPNRPPLWRRFCYNWKRMEKYWSDSSFGRHSMEKCWWDSSFGSLKVGSILLLKKIRRS